MGGLYAGAVSVAFLFFVLQRLYPDLVIEGKHMGIWHAEYLKPAEARIRQNEYPGPAFGRCGITDDVLAVLAISAASSKDPELAQSVCNYWEIAVDDETENEMMFGRAGYLYFLRLMKASFMEDPDTLRRIQKTQDEVVDAILDSRRPWKHQNTNYVGAMRGTIGIITQIVLTDPKQYAPEVQVDLATILTYQWPSGNFPREVSHDSLEKDHLVQFCHGAPGVVISLLSIRDHFPQLKDKIDKAIAKARECILERGLLTNEACIVHGRCTSPHESGHSLTSSTGISGNALALEKPEFEHFLTFTTEAEMRALKKRNLFRPSEQPESLFEGEAGRAWAWAVADLGLPKRVLGYNDL